MTFGLYILYFQEDERRIASVMARKEEEKKKETSKMAMMKVGGQFGHVYWEIADNCDCLCHIQW